MNEIIPNGSNIFTQSFLLKMAQDLVPDFEGRSEPDGEFNFDGYKIAGFEKAFGLDRRYIRSEDKNKVFQIVLSL
jgi:hypothetical protein